MTLLPADELPDEVHLRLSEEAFQSERAVAPAAAAQADCTPVGLQVGRYHRPMQCLRLLSPVPLCSPVLHSLTPCCAVSAEHAALHRDSI